MTFTGEGIENIDWSSSSSSFGTTCCAAEGGGGGGGTTGGVWLRKSSASVLGSFDKVAKVSIAGSLEKEVNASMAGNFEKEASASGRRKASAESKGVDEESSLVANSLRSLLAMVRKNGRWKGGRARL